MELTDKQRAILGVLSPGFGGTDIPDYIRDYLRSGLGGITLFGSNTPDLESTTRLVREIRAINPDCVISIDEEGGDVTRIWARIGSPFPSPFLLGRIDDESLTEIAYQQLGAQLALADIDVTFGPVLDLVISDENPIVGVRSFGSDQTKVARHGSAAVRGLAAAGIAACPKHFPGHGRTAADSHHALPTIDASLTEMRSEEVAPFAAAISAGARAIMLGHLVVPAVDSAPASLSRVWCEGVLRTELGFAGVVVTDALDMGALGGLEAIHTSAISAVRAGADLLCLSGIANQRKLLAGILQLAEVELGVADLERLETSRARLRQLRRNRQRSIEIDLSAIAGLATGLELAGNLTLKPGSTAILTLGAAPTVAAGHTNWGLEPAFNALGIEMHEFDSADNQIVQFRDAWRDPVVLERLRIAQENHPSAIFVDFGWPTREFAAANLIRAFGAGRAHADTVARLLLQS